MAIQKPYKGRYIQNVRGQKPYKGKLSSFVKNLY
jgi:hypothetical protein